MKEQFREKSTLMKLSGLSFGIFSANEMRDLSEISIVVPNLYKMEAKTPMEYGLLDARLGVSRKGMKCETCGKSWADCPGHFGMIDLEMPCFHVGFFKHIIHVLQCICKECSHFLLPPEKKEKVMGRLMRPHISYVEKKAIKKQLVADCKKVSKCPNCGSTNGVVKKCAVLKIVHLKYKHDKKTKNAEALEYVGTFENAVATNRELPMLLGKAQEFLNPSRVLELFRKIPRSDVCLLLMNQELGNPDDLVLTRILVPPCCIRPTVESTMRAGWTEDDLTVRLLEIIKHNYNLRHVRGMSEMTHKFVEAWDLLQLQVALLFNSDITGIPKFILEQIKQMSGVVQRLKGKQGRFRGNLSGKRANFSARTVISPDPHLRIDQVGLPMHMAKILTYPEKVMALNLDQMRLLILNGRNIYPGAVSVYKADMKMKFRICNNYKKLAKELKIGDIVERNISDGDIVLFNRQPSLHRLSIQAFKVKVTKNRTLQFNECCCNPFNADFDGDEMNIHFPQTEEAKAEALVLMDSKANIISPRNGEPLIAAIQDFITGSYLMTQKDRFFTKVEAAIVLSILIDTYIELPLPAILKPVPLWTGKQIFSLVMRPNSACDILVNVRVKCGGKQKQAEMKGDGYRCSRCTNELRVRTTGKFLSSSECISCSDRERSPAELCDGCRRLFDEIEGEERRSLRPCLSCDFFGESSVRDELDPNDGFIVVHNSQLLAGSINKSLLGSGSKNSIFYFILRDYGRDQAADALLRLSKLTSWYLMSRGFSIGHTDVAPIPELLQIKGRLLEEGYNDCNEYIEKFKNNELQVTPGCTEEQTLEGVLLRTLSQIRDEAGNACDRLLPRTNAPIVMATAGSKGSLINVCQMIVCVGQQSVNGKRVPNGFEDRSIFLFNRSCRDPASKGFVANSFFSGLTCYELFFHSVAGREGLVDTAVKTADTGYMQRRLMKAMEDLNCEYDGTVRNSLKEVVQFVYGSDGLDPIEMEAKYKKSKGSKLTEAEGIRPLDFGRVLEQVCRENPCRNEDCLTDVQVEMIFGKLLELREYRHLRGEKRKSGEKEVDHPERARNFGRHMQNFIESLKKNLEVKKVMRGAICQRAQITRTQLEKFLTTCSNKFLSSKVEPGTAVGALAAQSIGEPGTQMTLKTFHFAGVASMNITQGVPRIREIIDATKVISTPVAKCPLERPHDESFARRVKGRIEKTTLGEIMSIAVIAITEGDLSILLRVDLKRIRLLQLEINAYTIRNSLIMAKLKLTFDDIKIISQSEIAITPKFKGNPMWTLNTLKLKLPNVLVCGIPTVKRVVIQAKKAKDSGARPEYELIVEGTKLGAIMTTPGIIGAKVESNNIAEIKQCLGIEAARKAIMNEMMTTMSNHGMSVDTRHIMLLADTMTCKGDVMSVNRGGMAKNMESPLMLASFEKTGDHLYEAAFMSQKDPIVGSSEKIIMGAPVSLGTGSFKVLQKITKDQSDIVPRMTLFDSEPFHLPSALIKARQATQ